jgi:hypothetical protein
LNAVLLLTVALAVPGFQVHGLGQRWVEGLLTVVHGRYHDNQYHGRPELVDLMENRDRKDY